MEIYSKFLFLNLHYCITSCCLWAFRGSSYQVGEIKGQKKSWALLKPLPGFLSPITMLISAWTLPTGKSQAPLPLGEQKGKEDYDLEGRWGKQVEFAAVAWGVSMALAGPAIDPADSGDGVVPPLFAVGNSAGSGNLAASPEPGLLLKTLTKQHLKLCTPSTKQVLQHLGHTCRSCL